jgi:hypothetical protein
MSDLQRKRKLKYQLKGNLVKINKIKLFTNGKTIIKLFAKVFSLRVFSLRLCGKFSFFSPQRRRENAERI